MASSRRVMRRVALRSAGPTSGRRTVVGRRACAVHDALLRAPVDDDPQVDPLLTKRGVALYLGVSERTVDRLVAAGELRAYRIGGHRRLRLFELEEYVESQEAW